MRDKKRIYLIISILFVVFSVIAFAIPSDFTAAFWLSYVFMLISFGLLIYVCNGFIQTGLKPVSRFYRVPILVVMERYLGVQFIITLVYKFFQLPLWSAVIINVLAIGIALIGLISLDATVDYVENLDQHIKEKTVPIKMLAFDVEQLEKAETDIDIKQALHKLYDSIKYCDQMSSEQLVDIEKEITARIHDLSSVINKQEEISEIQRLVDERNFKCKMLK